MTWETRLIFAGIAIAFAAIAGWFAYDGIYSKGYEAAEADFAIAANAAIAERLAENERLTKLHVAQTNDLKKRHADEISRSRALSNAAGGLRVSAAVCSGFAAQAETDSASRGDGGSAATRLVPPAVDADFRALELKIEEVFAGCRVAQEFLKKNGTAP